MKACLFVLAARANRNTATTTTTTMTTIAATGLTLFFTRCHLLSQATAHRAAALRTPVLSVCRSAPTLLLPISYLDDLDRPYWTFRIATTHQRQLSGGTCEVRRRHWLPPQTQWNRPLHCPARRTIARAQAGVNPRPRPPGACAERAPKEAFRSTGRGAVARAAAVSCARTRPFHTVSPADARALDAAQSASFQRTAHPHRAMKWLLALRRRRVVHENTGRNLRALRGLSARRDLALREDPS